MHILIATPLYPPDIAGHGPYVKELAKRLTQEHNVTTLLYGNIPEVLADVELVVVHKKQFLPLRLFRYTVTFIKHAYCADIIYIQNGPSVELPALLVRMLFWRKPMVLHVADIASFSYKNRLSSLIFILLCKSVSVVLTYPDTEKCTPPSQSRKEIMSVKRRPEIITLLPYPTQAMADYELHWNKHIQELLALTTKLCTHQ